LISTIPESTVNLYEGNNVDLLRLFHTEADVSISSPTYFGKFDYGLQGQFGLEESVAKYLEVQVSVYHEVQRLLKEGGTCFIVIGDTSNNYSPVRAKHQRKTGDHQWHSRRRLEIGYREKETLNIPLRLAEALRQDGWVHRRTLIWDKGGGSEVPNSDAAPECHEYVLHMIKWSKKSRVYGNTRPLRSSVLRHRAASHPTHGCVFPLSLAEELLSVCPHGSVIIDPYLGSGTVALAARAIAGVVHGFDLDCSIAKAAIPSAVYINLRADSGESVENTPSN
jgi:site-specific DNA-methyltransferase (cytosine-N4-specific)